MIYFNLSCKKKDTHDYLITTCDNSLQFRRFFDIFRITKCGKIILLQSDRELLQNASGITKCDSCYKVRRNNCSCFCL